jgi:hypothetical protein
MPSARDRGEALPLHGRHGLVLGVGLVLGGRGEQVREVLGEFLDLRAECLVQVEILDVAHGVLVGHPGLAECTDRLGALGLVDAWHRETLLLV